MKRSKHLSSNSLSIAIFFIALTVLLVIGGILLKLFLLWRSSSFDGLHQYVIEVHSTALDRGEFVIFSPNTQSITTVDVKGRVDGSFARYLALPSDATVVGDPSSNVIKLLQQMLFLKQDNQAPTSLDVLRLLLFANSVNAADFKHQTISLPIDSKISETVLPGIFLDKDLYAENQSVTIVNATNVSGLGNKIAHMLTSIGINVIMVTTGSVQSASVLSAAHTTYTVLRMSHILGVPVASVGRQGLSDITLTIGKDLLSRVE